MTQGIQPPASGANEQANQYRISILTEIVYPAESHHCSNSDEYVLEARDVARKVSALGIGPQSRVGNFGDGAWWVSYESGCHACPEEGTELYYTLHLLAVNGEPVNPDNAQQFAAEVGLSFSNPYENVAPRKSSSLKFG